MKAQDAVDWHTQIADKFDKKYGESDDFIERFNVWSKIIDKYAVEGEGALDCGCGSGVFSFYLAEKKMDVTAVDGSAEMLRLCESKKNSGFPNLKFLHSKIENISNEYVGKFSLIVCSSVLEYVDNFDETLAKLTSMLASGGYILFSVPNANSVYRKIEASIFKSTGFPRYYSFVKNVKSLHELVPSLENFGMSTLEHHYYGQTPYITKMFRAVFSKKYSDNLLVIAAKKN